MVDNAWPASSPTSSTTTKCPFHANHQLNGESVKAPQQVAPGHTWCLPGHPRVKVQDRNQVLNFVERDLWSSDLEQMAPRLWWMSKQDSANISPLHRQRVKRRDIVISEDPKLHLVWIDNRIFIKPLPHYILSHAFWEAYLLKGYAEVKLDQQERVRRAALGYLRTYFYLIRYQSDFRIAKDEGLCLVPSGITWTQFCDFSSEFDKIEDDEVSTRYTYGEIRLTRLNFYAKILLRKSHFQRVEYQYAPYFARFFGPILFVFAFMSVVMSSIQVGAAIEQVSAVSQGGMAQIWHVCRWLSVATLVSSGLLILALGYLLVYKIAKEWIYALQDRLRGRRRGSAMTFKAYGSGNGSEAKAREQRVRAATFTV